MHDYSDTGPVAQGQPGVYDWERGGWPAGTDRTALILQKRGVKPGPLTNIGGAPGSGGTYQGGNTITPPAKPGAKPAPAPTQDQLNKQFAGMKPGAKITAGGKTYFKNQNGAVVDVTNPAARKRITDRQGKLIGQAAAPAGAGKRRPGRRYTQCRPAGAPADRQPASADDSWRPACSGRSTRRHHSSNRLRSSTRRRTSSPTSTTRPPLNQFGYPQNQGQARTAGTPATAGVRSTTRTAIPTRTSATR